MAFDTVQITITSAAGNGTSLTASYPSGRTKADYDAADTDHKLISRSNPLLLAQRGDFSVTFNASNVTVQITTNAVFSAGELVWLQLDRGDQEADREDAMRARYQTSRSALLSHITANGIENGAVYSDGTVQYKGSTGATTISDLPGLVPFGTPTLAHWPDTSAGQAEALTYAAAQTWSIPPWVIETVDEVRHDLYTEASGTEDAYAAIQINDSTDATHVGEARSSLSIISRPYGSGANGGANADWGMSVSVIKKGYAGGSAQPGAFNGIQVICRQDGQDAPSLSDPLRSDVAAFIANTTVVGESGWNGVLEATSTRLNRSGFTVAEQIQTQVGSISPNSGSIFSRGFTTIAKAGTLTCAFYAEEDGGTWGKYLEIPNKVLVGPSGIDWSQNTRITAVGTIQVTTTNSSAITFATNNTNRWSIGSGGSLLPSTDLGVNIGSASFKVNTIYAAGIILSGNNQQMNGLPVYADNAAATGGGLAAGRIYRTATGELRIVV